MKKTKLILIIIFSLTLLIGIGVFYIYENPFGSFFIGKQIKDLLPENTFLRDFEKIPDTDSYFAIYIENPELAEEEKEKIVYSSCSFQSLGQSIKGTYHFAVFKKGTLVSDIVQEPIQELVYKNIKKNIQEKTFKWNEFQMKKVKLINFQDLNGDGKEHEFRLAGETHPCGFTKYLIAGYDEQGIVYPIQRGLQTHYWMERFEPNSQGIVEIENACGDHGSNVLEKFFYSYDPEGKAYVLDKATIEECFLSLEIDLYYYNIEKDKEIAEYIPCSGEAVLPVKRTIEFKKENNIEPVIEQVIKLLLKGELSDQERLEGFSTEFPNPDFKLLDLELNKETKSLTLTFTEIPGFTSGGSCRVGLLVDQIAKTAKQFDLVDQVIFMPEYIFQP